MYSTILTAVLCIMYNDFIKYFFPTRMLNFGNLSMGICIKQDGYHHELLPTTLQLPISQQIKLGYYLVLIFLNFY